MQPTLLRRCFVEFLATFFLVLAIGITVSKGVPSLVPTAVAVAIIIGFYGPISGAHINPAFTLAYTLCKKFPLKELIPYCISQILGANLAVICLELSLRGDVATKLCTVLKTSTPNQLLMEPLFLEFLASFIFMVMILNILSSEILSLKYQGVWIAIAFIMVCILFGDKTDLILNPAKSLGTALFQYKGSTSFNLDGTITSTPYLRDGVITAVMSLLGGGLAGIVYSITHKKEEV